MTDTPESCGCRIEHGKKIRPGGLDGLPVAYIRYCRKHAAVDDLLAALESYPVNAGPGAVHQAWLDRRGAAIATTTEEGS